MATTPTYFTRGHIYYHIQAEIKGAVRILLVLELYLHYPILIKFNRALLEYLWASDDFEIFMSLFYFSKMNTLRKKSDFYLYLKIEFSYG